MNFAYNTSTFGGNASWLPAYTIDETMRRLARIGYKSIELVCSSPHAWPEYLSADDVVQIGKWQKEYGISIEAIMPLMSTGGPGGNLASDCKEELAWSRGYWKSCIDMAEKWGTKTVSYGAGWVRPTITPIEARKVALESLVEIASYASSRDITICIEPSNTLSEIVDTAQQALDFMTESGLNNVKVMFDMAWCFYYLSDPADMVLKMGRNLGHIHFCDKNRMAPGDGGFDFYPIMQSLKDIGYEGYISIEVGFSRSVHPTSIARKSLKYLQSIENKLN